MPDAHAPSVFALLGRVLTPGALALGGVIMALWSYTTVIQRFEWVPPIIYLAATLIALGMLLRGLFAKRAPLLGLLLALLAQSLIVIVWLTAMFGGQTSQWGFVPTGRTLQLLPYYFERASSEVYFGNAPLVPSAGVIFFITAAFGLLAILLDHLLGAGRVIIAAVIVATIGAVPLIVTGGGVDVLWFALFGLLVLLLLRFSLGREASAPRRSPLWLAAVVGVAAIGSTVVLGPSVPVSMGAFGLGQRVVLNASLNLGNDLRQPESVDVISLATSATSAPYLRVATLTQLEGQVWRTDEFERQALGTALSRAGLPEQAPLQTVSLRVQNVDGRMLPVPYPALGVQGMNGEWFGYAENRTVVSERASTRDQDYTVITLRSTPTLAQLQLDRAGGPLDPMHIDVPADAPPSIAALAAQVTASASTDIDRLLALQTWFRTQFRYSLNTPVEEGFDGSGAEAVGAFLEVREGYCVHFAAAFTLMARSLGIPARIVVGFLPGTFTGEYRGTEAIYRVTSDQLHAWPEVHFEEWGWIPFEPTASLGTAMRPPATSESEGGETGDPTDPNVTLPDRLDPSDDPSAPGETPGGGRTPAPPAINPVPFLIAVPIVLLALAAPGIVRAMRRRGRMRRAANGDAVAAWIELEDTLIDLRIPIPDAESIRALGARLVASYGAPASALRVLIDAVEAASYAHSPAEASNLATPLRDVTKALRVQAGSAESVSAALLPRSLAPGLFPLPETV